MNSLIGNMMFSRVLAPANSKLAYRSLGQSFFKASRSSLIAGPGVFKPRQAAAGSLNFATSVKGKGNPALSKFQAMQRHMQKDDGKPVWLKNPNDYKLYQLTWGLLLLGMVMNFALYISYII